MPELKRSMDFNYCCLRKYGEHQVVPVGVGQEYDITALDLLSLLKRRKFPVVCKIEPVQDDERKQRFEEYRTSIVEKGYERTVLISFCLHPDDLTQVDRLQESRHFSDNPVSIRRTSRLIACAVVIDPNVVQHNCNPDYCESSLLFVKGEACFLPLFNVYFCVNPLEGYILETRAGTPVSVQPVVGKGGLEPASHVANDIEAEIKTCFRKAAINRASFYFKPKKGPPGKRHEVLEVAEFCDDDDDMYYYRSICLNIVTGYVSGDHTLSVLKQY